MKISNKEKTSAKAGKKFSLAGKEAEAWLLIAPLLFLVVLLIWYPQIMSFFWSMCDMQGYTPTAFVGLKNYKSILSNTMFVKILLNTLKYVFWSLVIGYLLPLIVAIMMNEMVHFKSGFKTLIYFPHVLPGVAVSLMWYLMYFPDEGGMLNMILALFGAKPMDWLQNEALTIPLIIISTTWKAMPGGMLMYYATLQGVNRDLYEAATIDGAGVLRRLWSITLPQISGTMLLMLINQIIGIFQILEQPMAMTGGGPNNASISLVYWSYKQGFENFRVGPAMAIGNIVFAILIIMTIFYFKLNKKIEANN
ncbi:MAG: sugar ABC transporter permease [Oscillospiraceae bacterium]|nr:sugar ABC transporter permease [Oscillospiraceae bacterium]